MSFTICWSLLKKSICQCRRLQRCRSIPGSERSLGIGKGNPLQNSCLENPMVRGTWLTTVHRVAESEHVCTYMSIELVMPSNRFILCCPRPHLFLASVFPSIRVSLSESALHIRWPKYWSFSISPSNECSELISFRIDWFDLCCPGHSQESSLAPQFKSVNSLALNCHQI